MQCRLSEVAPVRHKGFDHTTQGAYAAAGAPVELFGIGAGRGMQGRLRFAQIDLKRSNGVYSRTRRIAP